MHIGEHLQNYTLPETKTNELEYWMKEIHSNVQKKFPKISYEKVFWRVKKNLTPANTQAVRTFHFRCLRETTDPTSPYKNYAHAFFARTKTK